MHRKILTVFAPITVIMLLIMAPAVAQANDQIQGTEYTVTSTNYSIQAGDRQLDCTVAAMQLQTTLSDEQAQVIGGTFQGPGGSSHCPVKGGFETAIFQTNAGTAGWFFHTGTNGEGSLQGALANIQLEVHLYSQVGQEFIDSCHFEAQNGLSMGYQTNTSAPDLTIHGELDFECGEGSSGTAQVEGDFFTTSNLTIDD